MKFLFASVPQWYPISPYLAGALLVGQLKKAGFEAESYDFNIDFFNDILTKSYLSECLKKAQSILEDNSDFISDDSLSSDINEKIRTTREIRRKIISEYLRNDNENSSKTLEETEWAVKAFKTKELFYDPEKMYRAKDVIKAALDIASLPYVPSRIMLDNFIAFDNIF